MSSSGHRYRIRSPLNSPRQPSPAGRPHPPDHDNNTSTLDTSDQGSDSDTDTVIYDSGREGSSTPNSRDTSVPPISHSAPRFAGLHDEVIPEQSLAATIPYEIILNIFRFLEPFGADALNCLFVCKSWCKCAVENVWFRPSIKNMDTFVNFASTVASLNRKSPTMFPYAKFVRRLNLLNVAKDLSSQHFALLAGCTSIERLTMGGAINVTDSVVESVIPKFKKLLALDISQVDLRDGGLGAIAQSCLLLQGLNVSHCSQITDESLMIVAENCHNLRRVLRSSRNWANNVGQTCRMYESN